MRALLPLVLLAAPAPAQLASRGAPASFASEVPGELSVAYVPRPDVTALLAEDEANGPFPFRYGAVVALELDLDRHGRWDELADGTLLWRAEIAAPGAFSLGVLLGVFDLPAGAELFAYSPDRARVIGGFGEATEQPNGMLALQPFPGDRLVLEVVLPAEVAGVPRLAVESVVYDYRDVLGVVRPDPNAEQRGAGCLIDVNCPAGQPYQDEKRAVVALFRGGFVCSASILNNTGEDATPYLFTAHHCGDFTNGSFLFRYERPGCGAGTATMSAFLSGAQLLAEDEFVDCQLYRLNQAPPATYTPFYAGWNRGGSPGAPAVGISHPAGLPKKIHLDHDAPIAAGVQWAVLWDEGEIQGGSSGSPLFDSNRRVIGPLCCAGGTCQSQTSFYGRLEKFWSRRPIAQYLDPSGNGAIVSDGLDPFRAEATPYVGSGLNPLVYTGTPPTVNATWVGTVDVSSFAGATTTLLLGYAAEDAGTLLAAGEVLVDLSSPLLFRANAGVSGGTSTHSVLVPNDPGLIGRVAFTQVLVLGGGARLTNGVKLRIG